MKRFLTTTALALTLGTAAIAESHMAMDWSAAMEPQAGQFYGSDLIGMRIYRAETDYDNWSTVNADAEREWDDIGEVNDLIISKGGQVEAVILGIGGFLGMGEHNVAIKMDSIRVLHEEDNPDDRFLVVNASKEQLESIPQYERQTGMTAEHDNTASMNTDNNATGTLNNESSDTASMNSDSSDTPMVPALQRPQVNRDGYDEVQMSDAQQINAEQLQGSRVYGANDEDLGEISNLVIDEGKLTHAIVDVGGFLGMGEKPVAVDFEKLQILKGQDSDELRVYMDATEESLKAQPEYTSQ